MVPQRCLAVCSQPEPKPVNGATSHPTDSRGDVREMDSRFDHRASWCGQTSRPEWQPSVYHGESDDNKIVPSRIARWKRILDLTCILLGSPVLAVVMMLVALWVKLVSPGPIFFCQERVGYLGQRFFLWKFRSMKVNAETQTHERYLAWLMEANRPMTKLDDSGDPRLIFGGRLLRALGLDELPQILNVVRGEMSLVGPRPCTPYEFGRYEPRHRERVLAPPGLTGYWQVKGKNLVAFSEMIKMDMFYVNNMSLGLDLKIILKTIPALLAQHQRSQASRSPGAVRGLNGGRGKL